MCPGCLQVPGLFHYQETKIYPTLPVPFTDISAVPTMAFYLPSLLFAK